MREFSVVFSLHLSFSVELELYPKQFLNPLYYSFLTVLMPEIKNENILKIIPVHLFMDFFFFNCNLIFQLMHYSFVINSLHPFWTISFLLSLLCLPYLPMMVCMLDCHFSLPILVMKYVFYLFRFSPTNCFFLIFVFINCIFFSSIGLMTLLGVQVIFFLYWLHSWKHVELWVEPIFTELLFHHFLSLI